MTATSRDRWVIAAIIAAFLVGAAWLWWHRSVHHIGDREVEAIRPALTRAAEREPTLLGSSRLAFCDVDVIGSDGRLRAGVQRYVYAWADCSIVRPRASGVLAFGSSQSSMVRFVVVGEGRGLRVARVNAPAFAEDEAAYFPRSLRGRAQAAPRTGSADPYCVNLRAARERFHMPGAPGVDAFSRDSPRPCRAG